MGHTGTEAEFRSIVGAANANHAPSAVAKRRHVDDEEDQLESNATAIAETAPKASAPENTYPEKSRVTSQCVTQ
jgi:hypothetical protein